MALVPKHLPQEIHSERLSRERRVGAYADENYVNPYKGGPTAIDKAVHMFFFTEIIRGEIVIELGVMGLTRDRDVDRR